MKEYRIGIVGCSKIAEKHAAAVTQIENAALTAVCDINKERADSFAQKYHTRTYYDYEEMLSDTDIDIVCVVTPSGFHVPMAKEAARYGKHVIVEKPLALNLDDADDLINVCRSKGVKLGVVHQNRYNKSVVLARKALENGDFGKITHVNATVRWNRNDAYYKEAKWRGTYELDGGCLMNQAIHNIDLLQWFLGPVESVFAHTATMVRDIEAPDIGVAVVKAKSGAFGIIEAANTIYPCNLEESLHIFGEKGTVSISGVSLNSLKAWRFSYDYKSTEEELVKEMTGVRVPPYYGHCEYIKDFIAAVESDRQPAVSGEEGRKAIELVLAMAKSSETGLPVNLPLENSFRQGAGRK